METVLLKTIHGSHLYGLAHADSDQDWYTVVSREKRGARKKYAKHNITGDQDVMKVDLSTFRHFCDEGVPQALEALFSPVPEVDLLTDFRNSYTVNLPAAVRTYRRTMRNFASDDSTFKKRRHACRLAINLGTIMKYGRFNPTMTEGEVAEATHFAMLMSGEDPMPYLEELEQIYAGTLPTN